MFPHTNSRGLRCFYNFNVSLSLSSNFESFIDNRTVYSPPIYSSKQLISSWSFKEFFNPWRRIKKNEDRGRKDATGFVYRNQQVLFCVSLDRDPFSVFFLSLSPSLFVFFSLSSVSYFVGRRVPRTMHSNAVVYTAVHKGREEDERDANRRRMEQVEVRSRWKLRNSISILEQRLAPFLLCIPLQLSWTCQEEDFLPYSVFNFHPCRERSLRAIGLYRGWISLVESTTPVCLKVS